MLKTSSKDVSHKNTFIHRTTNQYGVVKKIETDPINADDMQIIVFYVFFPSLSFGGINHKRSPKRKRRIDHKRAKQTSSQN